MPNPDNLVSIDPVERRILRIRGQRVILSTDLAELYGVPAKRLNEQVRRNKARFPEDFVFRLSREEAAALRSQIATSKRGRGGARHLPYAFTEHGAIMAANVLNSRRAVQASVHVVRAFVRLRQTLAPIRSWPRSSRNWSGRSGRTTRPSAGFSAPSVS